MKNALKFTALAAVLTLAACSNDSDDKKATENATEEATEENSAAGEMEAVTETAALSAEENAAYLAENKDKDGVLVTESGLQYRIVSEGAGATPTADDFVTVHYAGRLIGGTEFDSSYKRGEPATFPAGGLIKGWTEALLLMQVGDKWELTIPADIAYGERGAGGVIPPNATLVFDIELLGIKSEADLAAERDAAMAGFKNEQSAFLEENTKKAGITTTASGLQYRVITEGTGKSPTATSQVTVHYAGTLISGDEFDSSYKRGEPISFGLDQVIKGWTQGVQLMKEGGKYEFFIPYNLGYGERGSRNIPPYATLVFTVELISVDS